MRIFEAPFQTSNPYFREILASYSTQQKIRASLKMIRGAVVKEWEKLVRSLEIQQTTVDLPNEKGGLVSRSRLLRHEPMTVLHGIFKTSTLTAILVKEKIM